VACPTGAIVEPEPEIRDAAVLVEDRRRLVWLAVLLPLLVAGGAWLGRQFSVPASRLHPTVSLAERLVREQANSTTPQVARPNGTLPSVEELALERAEQSPAEILTAAASIRRQFLIGGWLFGGWVGVVVGAKLISVSVRRPRTDYEPEHGGCFACARCFEYCPRERVSTRVVASAVKASATGAAPRSV
jgi:hypothetical protein